MKNDYLNEPLEQPNPETLEKFAALGYLRTHLQRALKDLANARKRANWLELSPEGIDAIQRAIYVEDANAAKMCDELRAKYKGLGY